ncbi:MULTISPECIES: hypothetical protein [unclassified Chelatococcus]|uniref:hypothetical protein n=1 Tax=unclassified Chelatococcus TaxID=2638111 RepID=UPI00031E9B08|nr:hypothetical protein AL346_19120 [Chelatococcus sp. CO-6]
MTSRGKRNLALAGAVVTATLAMGVADAPLLDGSLRWATAEAIIGRPLTPLSYAGVARRTTRRAFAAGAAAGAAAAAPYYAAPVSPACVQIVDPYGRIVYRCP